MLYFSTAKSGIDPSECIEVAKHIINNCPKLKFCGLMTIGMFDRPNDQENPDFKVKFIKITICIKDLNN